MRRKYSPPPQQPGLFDRIDDFSERLDSGFEIIPPEKMEHIAKTYARPTIIDELPPLEASDKVFS